MPARAGASSAAPPDDVLRILVSSDMHLGYGERDPVRGDDSFQTFAEVFELANEHQVRAQRASVVLRAGAGPASVLR
jgi:double-strand break repair protein MRE11